MRLPRGLITSTFHKVSDAGALLSVGIFGCVLGFLMGGGFDERFSRENKIKRVQIEKAKAEVAQLKAKKD